ncbi:MAG: uncharacterized protein KVP18_002649 [Porospora cf. gigantea A]|uniref:uncharacterized protein n=1 Tax=Porospora cf. gigantea A TaxID=2853593 RepID=UPI00355ABE77|nr:MAG: hypothetical protein KVP18_002649 [Porospora cf. gigantea A]
MGCKGSKTARAVKAADETTPDVAPDEPQAASEAGKPESSHPEPSQPEPNESDPADDVKGSDDKAEQIAPAD